MISVVFAEPAYLVRARPLELGRGDKEYIAHPQIVPVGGRCVNPISIRRGG